MKKSLFFIAILPDVQIQEEVTKFKTYLAENFSVSHALRSPPHITLFPPFKWMPERTPELTEVLDAFAADEERFPVELKNFDCFAPRVIFVDVKHNEMLQRLQHLLEARLEQTLSLKNDRPYDGFHPHMTIAHKDLQRHTFADAWAKFSRRSYERAFEVEDITLLKHNGSRWEVYETFPLSV